MKLYIYPNRFNAEQVHTACECVKAFLKNGVSCAVPQDMAAAVGAAGTVALDLPPEECDAVVSVGGDGAVLRAAQIAVKAGRPLFGINNGHIGYLCRYSLGELPSLTEERLQSIQYVPHTLLAFHTSGEEHFALNDIVIAKRDFSTAMRVSAVIDGETVGKWHGDGLIIATPTGSTAYNRSAGGPRLLYNAGCFVMTPVCSYSSPREPIVFSDSSHMRVRLEESMMRPSLYADGVSFGDPGDTVDIQRYEKKLLLATR